ncbi:hypothetical protein FACS1894216_02260 [Synergistales bacterium]|nr:hypothetical protein FACS1894216_02260 [Synergistales bacterium]
MNTEVYYRTKWGRLVSKKEYRPIVFKSPGAELIRIIRERPKGWIGKVRKTLSREARA